MSTDFYFLQEEQMAVALLSIKILVLLQHRDVASIKKVNINHIHSLKNKQIHSLEDRFQLQQTWAALEINEGFPRQEIFQLNLEKNPSI